MMENKKEKTPVQENKGSVVEQSFDLNGDMSNLCTQQTAKETLASRKDLSPEQRQYLENKTQCLTGDAYKAALEAHKAKLKEQK